MAIEQKLCRSESFIDKLIKIVSWSLEFAQQQREIIKVYRTISYLVRKVVH